jgi:hypothetical protein
MRGAGLRQARDRSGWWSGLLLSKYVFSYRLVLSNTNPIPIPLTPWHWWLWESAQSVRTSHQ